MIGNLVSMILGMAAFGKEKAEELTAEWMEKGELQRDELRKALEVFIERGETERNLYIARMIENIESLKSKVVTKQDVNTIEKKLDYLNRKYSDD